YEKGNREQGTGNREQKKLKFQILKLSQESVFPSHVFKHQFFCYLLLLPLKFSFFPAISCLITAIIYFLCKN
ncbi:hypothetical protein FJR37_26180, partial [Aphanizomenon sp. UHCC 0183]|nr:hypothetical protein [Aphanizomenon sp. UHCC 0183]